MRIPTRSASVAVAVALALGGCGSTKSSLSDGARSRLTPLVERVRRAAEALDREGTRRALTDLRRAVVASEKNGDISFTKAAEILAATAQVQSRLALVPTTTTTTTTTTVPPDEGGGHGKKKDHGQGNGSNGD